MAAIAAIGASRRVCEGPVVWMQNVACSATGIKMRRTRIDFESATRIPRELNGGFRRIVPQVLGDRYARSAQTREMES